MVHNSEFWSDFIFKQFWNLKYQGKNVIILVFLVLGLFMVKLSFEILDCRVKHQNAELHANCRAKFLA